MDLEKAINKVADLASDAGNQYVPVDELGFTTRVTAEALRVVLEAAYAYKEANDAS